MKAQPPVTLVLGLIKLKLLNLNQSVMHAEYRFVLGWLNKSLIWDV